MDLGTHAYVGSLPCGCGVHFSSDQPDNPRMPHHVVDLLHAGYVVRWLPRADALAFSSRHCAAYPHEDWQTQYEQRLKNFMRAGHTP